VCKKALAWRSALYPCHSERNGESPSSCILLIPPYIHLPFIANSQVSKEASNQTYMSATINYFFNYNGTLLELASAMNMWLGCNLAPYEGNQEFFFSRFLSMEFSLSSAEHLENDGELDFENFQYELGFRTPLPDASARPIQLPTILVVVYALHRSLDITGLLVYGVDTLLARYFEQDIDGYGRRLYDVISDTPFVSFQAHLDTIARKLPKDWQDFYDNPFIIQNS